MSGKRKRVRHPQTLIERWPGAPGWDTLLERADDAVRRDVVRPGHWHIVSAVSSGPSLEFVPSLVRGTDTTVPCPELAEALAAITEASKVTCHVCGKPGVRRAGSLALVVCDTDMGLGDEAPHILLFPPPGWRRPWYVRRPNE